MAEAQPSKPNNAIAVLLRHDRFKRIINWLCEHSEELIELDKVQIIFDCAGKKVSAKKTESYKDI